VTKEINKNMKSRKKAAKPLSLLCLADRWDILGSREGLRVDKERTTALLFTTENTTKSPFRNMWSSVFCWPVAGSGAEA
jgi:hypothetical protein